MLEMELQILYALHQKMVKESKEIKQTVLTNKKGLDEIDSLGVGRKKRIRQQKKQNPKVFYIYKSN
jgi:hypothetical protein